MTRWKNTTLVYLFASNDTGDVMDVVQHQVVFSDLVNVLDELFVVNRTYRFVPFAVVIRPLIRRHKTVLKFEFQIKILMIKTF